MHSNSENEHNLTFMKSITAGPESNYCLAYFGASRTGLELLSPLNSQHITMSVMKSRRLRRNTFLKS